MGINVEFTPGPRLERTIRSASDVAALRVPDPHESTPYVLEAIRLLRRELPAAVPLIGFAGAPFTMATYLVEGRGTKQFAEIKRLLFSDPGHRARAALDVRRDRWPISRGAGRSRRQAAMLFDTWASLLAPSDYREFALPYVSRVFADVKRVAHDAGA